MSSSWTTFFFSSVTLCACSNSESAFTWGEGGGGGEGGEGGDGGEGITEGRE